MEVVLELFVGHEGLHQDQLKEPSNLDLPSLSRTTNAGLRANEAKHINLSLTTLGMCINARADPAATHVPFRDSKLTRLLQVRRDEGGWSQVEGWIGRVYAVPQERRMRICVR